MYPVTPPTSVAVKEVIRTVNEPEVAGTVNAATTGATWSGVVMLLEGFDGRPNPAPFLALTVKV
jgi:hypothetical protein